MNNYTRIYIPETNFASAPASNNVEAYSNALKDFRSSIYSTIESERGWKTVPHPEHADVIVVREPWGFKNWEWIHRLQSNQFLKRFAGKIVVYNADDLSVPFFPGFYTSPVKSKKYAVETVSFPYWRTFISHGDIEGLRRHQLWLWYFRGSLRTHRVRRRLYRVLAREPSGRMEVNDTTWGRHQEEERAAYVRGMRSSRFALCPRGASPSSFRLYEAMQLGVAPVVISDDWQPPTGIAWREFAVFVKEKEIKDLPNILANVSHDSDRRGRVARQEWERTLSDAEIARFFLRRLRWFVETKWVPRTFDELWAIWHSKEFVRGNNWHLAARAQSRVRRHISAVELYLFRKCGFSW